MERKFKKENKMRLKVSGKEIKAYTSFNFSFGSISVHRMFIGKLLSLLFTRYYSLNDQKKTNKFVADTVKLIEFLTQWFSELAQ